LTLIIFLKSKEESDRQFQNQLNHLQRLNAEHIQALQHSTDKQIKTLQELNAKQISALQELTEKQITALQELTEKQIETIRKTTFDQISSFEQQTREVTNKLTDNSILLAEILARELEKSIELYIIMQLRKKKQNILICRDGNY
jgi:ABC-type lipoprotein release transport system permease subunit